MRCCSSLFFYLNTTASVALAQHYTPSFCCLHSETMSTTADSNSLSEKPSHSHHATATHPDLEGGAHVDRTDSDIEKHNGGELDLLLPSVTRSSHPLTFCASLLQRSSSLMTLGYSRSPQMAMSLSLNRPTTLAIRSIGRLSRSIPSCSSCTSASPPPVLTLSLTWPRYTCSAFAAFGGDFQSAPGASRLGASRPVLTFLGAQVAPESLCSVLREPSGAWSSPR